MLGRLIRSIRFRVSHQFRRRMLARYRRRVLDRQPFSAPAKPPADFTLLSIIGQKQLELLQLSLWSIGRAWTKLPALRVVSDGSLDPAAILKSLQWWPHPVESVRWETIAQSMADRGRPDLQKLASGNMLARKLCAILDSAERHPTLFCDSDILWFRGPPPMPDGEVALKLSEDLLPAFDAELFYAAGFPEFSQKPFLNTGVVFARGDLYNAASLWQILPWACEHPQYFTEQTLLSYVCKRLEGDHWLRQQIYLSTDDATDPWGDRSYMATALARHYVGDVRHWFWRDGLYLLQSKATGGNA